MGEPIYRALAKIQRLVPTNVGVLDIRNMSRRFSLHAGANVLEAFSDAEAQTKSKTNIFAFGYEDGERVSIGASLKGRVWSFAPAESILHWMQWCDDLGTKLLDATLTVSSITQRFIQAEPIATRPPYIPIGLEWPWDILMNVSEGIQIVFEDKSWPLLDVELTLLNERDGAIQFELVSPDWQIPYELILGGEMKFNPLGQDAMVKPGFQESVSLKDFINKRGLTVLMEQEAEVIPPGFLLKPNRELPPFSTDKLQSLEWNGVDLKVESQGASRRTDSIQYAMIEHVKTLADWDLILDDDGTGEIADIVAIRIDGGELAIHLIHCKWAIDGKVTEQIKNLYEVCGQAAKSVRWRRDISSMLENLLRREKNRRKKHNRNGIIKGTDEVFHSILDNAPALRHKLTVSIAQPGMGKSQATESQLELLASMETYVNDVAAGPFNVFCSA